jgi:hypothetical protein
MGNNYHLRELITIVNAYKNSDPALFPIRQGNTSKVVLARLKKQALSGCGHQQTKLLTDIPTQSIRSFF